MVLMLPSYEDMKSAVGAGDLDNSIEGSLLWIYLYSFPNVSELP